MSVTDVVQALRRAHTLLSTADNACIAADKAIGEGATAFTTATSGSTQPKVEQAAGYASAAADSVQAARAGIAETQALIDAYCRSLVGDDFGAGADATPCADPAPLTLPPTARTGDGRARPQDRYAVWIAELLDNGTKINPAKVVWMTRHRDGRLIWLEEGTERSAGLAHILRPGRTGNFQDMGVPRHRVADLIRDGIDHGRLVGYVGRDREVYEVIFDGRVQRVAVLIGSNGFIVTSHPLDPEDESKVRPDRHRK